MYSCSTSWLGGVGSVESPFFVSCISLRAKNSTKSSRDIPLPWLCGHLGVNLRVRKLTARGLLMSMASGMQYTTPIPSSGFPVSLCKHCFLLLCASLHAMRDCWRFCSRVKYGNSSLSFESLPHDWHSLVWLIRSDWKNHFLSPAAAATVVYLRIKKEEAAELNICLQRRFLYSKIKLCYETNGLLV